MPWTGHPDAVTAYLRRVGADVGRDNRFIISGAPVEGTSYGELEAGVFGPTVVLVRDETVYFVQGRPQWLAPGLAFTANPQLNPDDLTAELMGEAHRWARLEFDLDPEDYDEDTEIKAYLYGKCRTEDYEDKDGEFDEKKWERDQKRITTAVQRFLDAEWASTLAGQQEFKGKGWGRGGKPKWRGTVSMDFDPEPDGFAITVEIPAPVNVSDLGRTLYVMGRLDEAVEHVATLCDMKVKRLRVPARATTPQTAMTPEYREALDKQKRDRVAAEAHGEYRRAIAKLKKGGYTVGPPSRTRDGSSYELLYRGKPVGVTFYETAPGGRDPEYRTVSFNQISWAGKRPSDTRDPASHLFYDISDRGPKITDLFPRVVEKVQAIKQWRAGKWKPGTTEARPTTKKKPAAKKPAAKKQAAKRPVELLRKDAKPSLKNTAEVEIARGALERYRGQQPRAWVRYQLLRNGWSEDDAEVLLGRYYDPSPKKKQAKKKQAKKKQAKKKPAKKKPAKKKPAKKKPAKKKPAKKKQAKKKPAQRRAAKRSAMPQDPTDLIAMARWARGE
jgi:histone H1/5